MKEVIGIVAAALAFVAYGPYLRDMFRGKTYPHPYSWFIWGFLTAIIFALQISHGGGAGSYVTATVAVLSFVIFFFGLKEGVKDITRSDTIFFILALVATGAWLFAKQPTLSMVLLVGIDILGFLPTVRKAWSNPQGETLFTWSLNSFRHALSIVAIQKYSLLTVLNPTVWALANFAFSIMLIVRRRQLFHPK
ncbi:hypothetical protein A3A71_03070 [Candidatus Berkelbacteria bacterium RIFCSPLOWO2_01_FULL_50_28]|uniref:Uncharacterized protein n=1 Tax=Candidatus Berkelbacteria bacterium RIFCSPLOWO2_01_FULL_50_28 TaxID=1797471 RepID=A0A1F5ECB3_9BACT|nr:MAG: hypothetical protein A2807_02635 [Candidatus Berkelbacteria bacterium RIFCSPHIGHO2_01_FULL_50_36]OGD63774.1 MAG: hypothetical protein A3F39_03470 [Candidatus Berkelbacteria bacterium RIFCSPHIGHO2_12_FULL_50_11]OGD65047.1 MAG: hypothetical protein A3A71_03070 [Candidatus Berkelbacteria bacterium RIFCSPLOWO2_01_FULL_50_28]